MRLLLLRMGLATLLWLSAAPGRAALGDCAGDITRSNPSNRIVELATSLGSVCIELLEDQTPLTTANFLTYLGLGQIDGTFFHRSVSGNIVIAQAGGFRVDDESGLIENIPPVAPAVQNEPCKLDELVPDTLDTYRCSQRGNERGTLAMAKIGDPVCTNDPAACVPRPDWITTLYPREEFVNSATKGWFINAIDGRQNLDNQNGGVTVFARVLGNGMEIVDELVALPHLQDIVYSLAADPTLRLASFTTLPVRNLPPPGGFGCFDVGELAVHYDEGGALVENPDEPSTFEVLSGACGTRLADASDFVPNPSQSETCTNPDRFGEGVVNGERIDQPLGTLFIRLVQDVSIPYSFTCAEVAESIAQLAARRAATVSQLVYVHEAIDLPEPSASLRLASALAALAALARKRIRRAT